MSDPWSARTDWDRRYDGNDVMSESERRARDNERAVAALWFREIQEHVEAFGATHDIGDFSENDGSLLAVVVAICDAYRRNYADGLYPLGAMPDPAEYVRRAREAKAKKMGVVNEPL